MSSIHQVSVSGVTLSKDYALLVALARLLDGKHRRSGSNCQITLSLSIGILIFRCGLSYERRITPSQQRSIIDVSVIYHVVFL